MFTKLKKAVSELFCLGKSRCQSYNKARRDLDVKTLSITTIDDIDEVWVMFREFEEKHGSFPGASKWLYVFSERIDRSEKLVTGFGFFS